MPPATLPLREQHCQPRRGPEHRLDQATIHADLAELPGWQLAAVADSIRKDFRFNDFYQTMAFVNAVAFIAHREDHHPDLEIGYGHCHVRYSTHDVGGVSANDLICAAKVEALATGA
ncbi:MAG: 4a-hydroxytetrahydrobiopterin dehydratase [Lysobacterales bacterium CG02_land_8_20_14_3_00_62_12]|nr:MAG: 4a-hydroxytetrahydrobiopterin dehydratase [Xanthomonadales bacterium CG02_land_8_20_14_3_00_62_12]